MSSNSRAERRPSMIRTFLVLGRTSVERIKENPSYLRGRYKSGFHSGLGKDAVIIDRAVDRIPSSLRVVVGFDCGFDYFVIEQYNAPYRREIPDGPYEELLEEGSIKARVVTEERGHRLVQSYVVEGRFLTEVYDWFNELVAGKKNDKCLQPAKPITEPPLSLHVLQSRDAALRKVEEMLRSDLGRYEDLAWLERDLKEIKAILAGVDYELVTSREEDGLELDVTKRAGLTCIMDDIQQSSEVSTDLLELRAWLAGHLERMATILGVRR
jgi:hypothetical protein